MEEILTRAIAPDGTIEFSCDFYDSDIVHNRYGPARIYKNGDFEYWIHGILHRVDGPAIYRGGEALYYLNGIRYTLNEFSLKVNLSDEEISFLILKYGN